MPDPAGHDIHTEIPEDVFCPVCEYNLRGLTGDVCPECGNSFAAMRLAASQIPWPHRRFKGGFIAYWKTVFFVMFRQRELCNEMAREVSYTDAQRFRIVTVLYAVVPVAVLAFFVYLNATPCPTAGGFLRGIPHCQHAGHWPYTWVFPAGWPLAAFVGFLALALAIATGVSSYFVRPRDMPVQLQNRAIALTYYAAAPLAWTFIPVILCMVGWSLIRRHEVIAGAMLLFAIVLLIVELGVWWSDSVQLLRRIMPGHMHRVRLAGVSLPILWVMVFAAVFGLASIPIIYVGIVVETLR